jgi:hypothetical protein
MLMNGYEQYIEIYYDQRHFGQCMFHKNELVKRDIL